MSRNSHAGFTLLELLVATGITLLLSGLLLALVVNVLGWWRQAHAGFGTVAQSSLALDLLESDLQGAQFRPQPGVWLAVSCFPDYTLLAGHGWLLGSARRKPGGGESLRLVPTGGTNGLVRIQDARFGVSGVWLRFITNNVETGGSQPVVVSYQLSRRPVTGPINAGNPAPIRYLLYRSAVTAEATFAQGYDLAGRAFDNAGSSPGQQRSPATVANPAALDVLAVNVVDFGIWLHARSQDGSLRRIFPENPNDREHMAIGSTGPGDSTRMPEVADVMLRVLTDEGAELIAAVESGQAVRPTRYASDAEWWWAVVEANSRVLVRRIRVGAGT